jgi:hypothetical protein
MTSRDQPGHGWTVVLRRRPARIDEGRPEGGYTDAFEIICCDCGDHPDLDYREVSPGLQRIRGRYLFPAVIAACQKHVGRHQSRQAIRQPARLAGHLDEEQPGVDHAARQARHRGRDQPVQATTCLQDEGGTCDASERGGDHVGGEPLGLAGRAAFGTGDRLAGRRGAGPRRTLRPQPAGLLRAQAGQPAGDEAIAALDLIHRVGRAWSGRPFRGAPSEHERQRRA